MSSPPPPDDQRPDGTAPISGQPWPSPSGDPLSSEPHRPPPTYAPGYASLPEPPTTQQPSPTTPFPPVPEPPGQPGGPGQVNYAPPGQAPDYGASYPPPPGYAPGQGQGYPPPGYAAHQSQGQGYPPPGYPPQQGYPPPGYPPYQPPPKPARRSSAPWIALIVAVSLLLCGGVVTAGVLVVRNITDRTKEAVGNLPTAAPELPGLPTELPTDPGGSGTGRTISVRYEIEGEGTAQILYTTKRGQSPTRADGVTLPWKFETKVETPALLSVVAMRLDGTSTGTISCRTLVDGKEVRANTSNAGTFASTSCTQFVLD